MEGCVDESSYLWWYSTWLRMDSSLLLRPLVPCPVKPKLSPASLWPNVCLYLFSVTKRITGQGVEEWGFSPAEIAFLYSETSRKPLLSEDSYFHLFIWRPLSSSAQQMNTKCLPRTKLKEEMLFDRSFKSYGGSEKWKPGLGLGLSSALGVERWQFLRDKRIWNWSQPFVFFFNTAENGFLSSSLKGL